MPEIVCTRNFCDIGLMIVSCNGKSIRVLARPFNGTEREYGGVESSKWYRTGVFTSRFDWNKRSENLTTEEIISHYHLKNTVVFDEEPKRVKKEKNMNEAWKQTFKTCISDYEAIQILHNHLIIDDEDKTSYEHNLLNNIIEMFRGEVEE